MARENELARACAALRRFATLPLTRVEHDRVTVVRDARLPQVWDANHACDVRARSRAEIDEVFAIVDRELPPNVVHRDFRTDPQTPPEFVARLVHEGFVPSATLQMRLDTELAPLQSPCVLREVATDADWQAFAAMAAADLAEVAAREGRAAYPAEVARGLMTLKRACAPAVRFWIAELEERACGHIAAWPGDDGIGILEWVYVDPSARRQGVASALVSRAAADARTRGAQTLLIGPLEGSYEAPRRCYARLGFEPWFLSHRFIRVDG